MKKIRSLFLSISATAFGVSVLGAQIPPKNLEACDVVWTSLGLDSQDSMPLGNGVIGLNVWTEPNGDIVFYISKSDAWSDCGDLVKVGRVRVTLSPNPFVGTTAFRQHLSLADGEICISGGQGADETTLRIWVDANHPVIRAEATAAKPVSVKVTLDPWRSELVRDPNGKVKVSADIVLPPAGNRLTWYHRNEKPFGENAKLLNATFGALMEGPGLVNGEGLTLCSTAPATTHQLAVYPLTATTPAAADWIAAVEKQAASLASVNLEKSRAEHREWWHQFWNRSWIFIQGDDAAAKVTQGYTLQRFITACAGRGAHAIKFNGSIFTADNPAEKIDRDKATGQYIFGAVTADYRAWGGKYWFQNTRAIYWPLLAAGDFDLMRPFFNQYFAQLAVTGAQVKEFYGHDGAYIAEGGPFWGRIRDFKPETPDAFTSRYYTPILELSAMMLDYYAYTGDDVFARETLLPLGKAGLMFFAQHFPRDAAGKLFIDRANAIEMYWGVTNPLTDIAGLHYVIGRLLELPNTVLDAPTRAEWTQLQSILPEIPNGVKDGKPVLLPYAGEQTAKSHNTENPELYAVHPFRIYGVGKPGLEIALNTYAIRKFNYLGCWHQDVIDAPLLGLTVEAKKNVTTHFTKFDTRLRFPAFWSRGHDYMPDQDNGGNGELGLQKMLIQCDGRKILLLPAWPSEWNADFRLHAPLNTVITGRVEAGKIIKLDVTPPERRVDVVMANEK